ncbi:hypothetical protein RclHR1_06520012 [Rhizophagus clarus]|uniref:PCP312R-like protein n=1 Tax=Rhizophagus clarus TaxID=94130 RepID=A0A2Z6RSM0_9GLOM|nr:hypothetical protein RclHR1_06520012 [Rhizophagus clarus]GES87489.1 pCP312R-like protein [Rhizophagus clarus]
MHVGYISPSTDASLAEMIEKFQGKDFTNFKKRERRPSIQIRKWKINIETETDGLTIKRDTNNVPILSDDSYKSDYFMAIDLLNEIISAEINTKTRRANRFIDYIKMKKIQDVPTLIQEFPEPITAGNILFDSTHIQNLRENLPYEEVEKIKNYAIKVSNAKFSPSVQKFISSSNKNPKSRNKQLPNPIAQIGLKVLPSDSKHTTFFDKARPYILEGRLRYHSIMDVTNDNIHRFIIPRTLVTGIINIDSLCSSQTGISLPVRAIALVLDQPIVENKKDDLDIIMGDMDDVSFPNKDTYIHTKPPVSVQDEGYWSGGESKYNRVTKDRLLDTNTVSREESMFSNMQCEF